MELAARVHIWRWKLDEGSSFVQFPPPNMYTRRELHLSALSCLSSFTSARESGSSLETPALLRHAAARKSLPDRRNPATCPASGPMRKSIGTASSIVPAGRSSSQGSPMHQDA